jgi:hypothetical protein
LAFFVYESEPSQSVVLPRPAAVHLWSVAVLGFGVGDVVTTAVGLQVVGVVELNPLVAGLFRSSILGTMVALKLFVLCVAYLLCRRLPRGTAVGIPLGLAVLGVFVTVWNFHVVLQATGG